MVTAATQKRQTKAAKVETAKAEEFIEQATEEVKTRRKRGEYTCTKEDIERERDERGLSWKQVAVNLGLGSPGAARKAYSDLTGRPHNTSNPVVNRAPRGSGSSTVALLTPLWDDDSDQDEIIEKVQGEWIPESGSGKTYVPGHFRGSTITVRRKSLYTQNEYEETLRVSRIDKFAYDGKNEDGPLVVHLVGDTGFRCFKVTDIVAVR